jgi:acyl carrier protein
MTTHLNELLAKIFDMRTVDIKPTLSKQEIYKWDSLMHMELVTVIENNFSIQMTMEEIIAIDSVQKIIDVLSNHGVDINVVT